MSKFIEVAVLIELNDGFEEAHGVTSEHDFDTAVTDLVAGIEGTHVAKTIVLDVEDIYEDRVDLYREIGYII